MRTLLRPAAFVDPPFGHDGKVARLAGGMNWFAAVELIVAIALGQMGTVYGTPRMPGRYSWTVAARDVETEANAIATASADVQ